jgi:hypothetical protein
MRSEGVYMGKELLVSLPVPSFLDKIESMKKSKEELTSDILFTHDEVWGEM